jgi:hypothetical protein
MAAASLCTLDTGGASVILRARRLAGGRPHISLAIDNIVGINAIASGGTSAPP